MSKLILMCGLPASGKSTKAKELVEAGAYRINKDLLREMLHFNHFTRENEEMTYMASKALADFFLGADATVVIDDTNMNPRTMDKWHLFAKQRHVQVDVVYMDTDVEECVRRDALREKSVGESVIREMHEKYGKST